MDYSSLIDNIDTYVAIIESTGGITIDIGGISYKTDTYQDIARFIFNIILVLDGKRLAYRADIQNELVNGFLIQEMLEKYSDILARNNYERSEPLIFLKENNKIINDTILMAKKGYIDKNEAFGSLLGYLYVGPNWASGYRNVFEISYYISNDENEVHLYTFNIPVDEYTQDMRNEALNKEESFNDTFSKYGYTVKVKASFHKKDTFDHQLLEELPYSS